jgi:hypothetical protein
MTVQQKIVEHVKKMPEFEQIEVLDFIEYLEKRSRERQGRQEDKKWSGFSLSSAMKGIEEEPEDYKLEDLKETF